MTPERLRQLIEGGETLAVEFKGERREPLPDRDLVAAVVCLANRAGDDPGWLLVGVEDDGTVTGARPRHRQAVLDPLQVQALIANRTRPSLSCRCEVVQVDGQPVLVVEVPASPSPIGTADGTYVRRAIGSRRAPECLPFHFHEMQARLAGRGLLDYSTLPHPEARWDDLDPLEFERFRRSIRESGRGDAALLDLPDLELAKALGAIEANHQVSAVRVLGLLLFGKEDALRRLLPTHETAFQVLSGTDVDVNQFYRWPLLRLMDEMLAQYRARYREQEIMVNLRRVGVPNYPERAYREGVANALVHRDYTCLAAVYVQWHTDRIEVSNPGGFPYGVRLDSLLVTTPHPRNPLLADAFKRAGIVERTGRGIDTIFFEELRNGYPPPSYERSTETDVVLVLRGGAPDLAFARLVTEENLSGPPLALEMLLILNRLASERRLAVAEAAATVQRPEADARSLLEYLVERGLVEARGERHTRVYHLSAATYRRLGQASSYARQRGFEPLQQEQMVLQYIRAHGRITRAQTAELCQISADQAKRLLGRLTDRGEIVPLGAGRATWYELRP